MSATSKCDTGEPQVPSIQHDERESIAKWMIENGYVTGHGDIIEDLLNELEAQAIMRGCGLGNG